MSAGNEEIDLWDVVEELVGEPEFTAWLAAHPADAVEATVARRVHSLLAQLQTVTIALPPDFEARLLARCRQNTVLLDLLDLWLVKGGRLLLDLLEAFSALLPAPTLNPA